MQKLELGTSEYSTRNCTKMSVKTWYDTKPGTAQSVKSYDNWPWSEANKSYDIWRFFHISLKRTRSCCTQRVLWWAYLLLRQKGSRRFASSKLLWAYAACGQIWKACKSEGANFPNRWNCLPNFLFCNGYDIRATSSSRVEPNLLTHELVSRKIPCS
jgi:hypothetical protein